MAPGRKRINTQQKAPVDRGFSIIEYSFCYCYDIGQIEPQTNQNSLPDSLLTTPAIVQPYTNG